MEDRVFKASAHPTMGIVLLGGLKNSDSRFPFHDSAGIAYSLKDKESASRTELIISDSQKESFINGQKVEPTGSRSPFKALDPYRNEIIKKNGLPYISVNSWNENILSGSSDSGAAALMKCLVQALPEIDVKNLEIEMRKVSESVGRSYYGGLTVTENHEKPVTSRILDESEFSDYSIISAVFPHTRKPSDDIHFNQPESPEYVMRVKRANQRVERLRTLAENHDIEGIFELAMEDTDDYHNLNDKVGVHILTEHMRSLLHEIRIWRSDVWMTYIVTGGNSVFIPCHKKDAGEIIKRVAFFTGTMHELKVAGKASSGT